MGAPITLKNRIFLGTEAAWGNVMILWGHKSRDVRGNCIKRAPAREAADKKQNPRRREGAATKDPNGSPYR